MHSATICSMRFCWAFASSVVNSPYASDHICSRGPGVGVSDGVGSLAPPPPGLQADTTRVSPAATATGAKIRRILVLSMSILPRLPCGPAVSVLATVRGTRRALTVPERAARAIRPRSDPLVGAVPWKSYVVVAPCSCRGAARDCTPRPHRGARATAAGGASALEHRAHVLEVRDERVPVGLDERLLGGVLGVTVGG